jgi:alkylated DNA repair dioxygenase AlkB
MTFFNPETKETFGVVLPKRSALLMTGKARYFYEHQINERRVDRTEKGLIYRKLRISLTFRRLKEKPFCDCNYPLTCDY